MGADARKPYSLLREVLAAGLGCAVVDALFNPLEVLKVRLQNGRTSCSSVPTVQATRSILFKEVQLIVSNDGVLGLWKPGLLPTVLRGLLYVGFRIGFYPTAKSLTPTLFGSDIVPLESFSNKLLSGSICGAVGSLMFTPLDVIRIRFQANPAAYPSTLAAFSQITHSEGIVRGLWAGVSVNVLRAAMLSGTQLGVYDQLKTTVLHSSITVDYQYLVDGPVLHMCASLTSGSIAQCVIMPVDAMKTKLMLSATNSSDEQVQRRLLIAAKDIYTANGVRGFYRGLVPALMRQGPSMLIQMPLIEQLRKLFGLEYL